MAEIRSSESTQMSGVLEATSPTNSKLLTKTLSPVVCSAPALRTQHPCPYSDAAPRPSPHPSRCESPKSRPPTSASLTEYTGTLRGESPPRKLENIFSETN